MQGVRLVWHELKRNHDQANQCPVEQASVTEPIDGPSQGFSANVPQLTREFYDSEEGNWGPPDPVDQQPGRSQRPNPFRDGLGAKRGVSAFRFRGVWR
jgi:hypothetical protein